MNVEHSEISWTILGSSSGIPSPDRNCSGHLLKAGQRLFLFDCGSGVTAAFQKYGFDPDCLESIFISHMHSDHISDLPLFIQLLYNLKSVKPLTVYLPWEAIEPIDTFLNCCYLFREKFSFRLKLEPVVDSTQLDLVGLLVTSIPNNHLQKSALLISEKGYPNRMQSYSFLIDMPGSKRILYSADLGAIEDILPYMENLNLLILEGFHIDLAGIDDYLTTHHIPKVVVTHIPDHVRSEVLQYIKFSRHKHSLQAAEDGLTISL